MEKTNSMLTRRLTALTLWALALLAANSTVFAQSGLVGTVCDETGGALPGVSVQVRAETWIREAITDAQGNYRFAAAPPGPLRLTFALINFAGVRRDIEIPSTGTLRVDVTLQLSMDADVTVTGKGAASINYVNSLARTLVRIAAGVDGHRRAMTAASTRLANGDLLGAIEIDHNDGSWTRPDDYRKINALVRYTRGNSLSGWSLTGMAYRGTWSSTDQIPERAVTSGLLGRFDGVDPTDGGDTYRYSGSFEWQRTRGNAATRLTAYGIAYDLNLFSNFTYFLDDPANGDQFEQTDHRIVSGARLSQRRLGQFAGRPVQNTFGVQLRNDDISKVGLYHTAARHRLGTVPRRQRRADVGRGVLPERDGVDAVAANARRPSRRRLSLRR
jgi:Carboxypeptidase regulatory-like domain